MRKLLTVVAFAVVSAAMAAFGGRASSADDIFAEGGFFVGDNSAMERAAKAREKAEELRKLLEEL